MFNAQLQWHPQFTRNTLSSGDVLLLSEKDQYLISEKEFSQLDAVIKGDGFSSDFIFSSDDIVEQVQRMQRVEDLFEKAILTGYNADVLAQYSCPDFTKTAVQFEVNELSIYLLSEQTYSSSLLSDCLESLGKNATAVVIVEDLLDPRLKHLNRKFIQEKTNWLLLKPTGHAPSIGPLFTIDDKLVPCYECLLFRLTQNNPVREWLRRQSHAENFLPIPLFTGKGIDELLDAFKVINRAESLNAINANQLCAFEGDDKKPVFHHVHYRPQCTACGDPSLSAKLHNEPVKVKDCFRNDSFDGGYRVNDAEKTIATLRQFISPVTGALTELSEITPQTTQKQLSIYRAAYFQNTFKTSAPTDDTFVQLSLGKGVLKPQAIASALGEAMERHAAQYTGEETTHFSIKADLPARAFIPQELTPFSNVQYEHFKTFDGPSLLQPQWVKKYDHAVPIHWVQGWSLTRDEAVYFPAAYCLANAPFVDQIYSLYSHNGNAAGVTQEEAILQGALELIERDAVAIWWYNQIPRPEISIDTVPENYKNVIAETLDADWSYWLLDLTHDISVTTCVAVGQHKKNGKFVLGFGCHLDPAIAAQRALTEMYQLITIKDKVTGPFDFDQLSAHPFLKSKRKTSVKQSADFNFNKETNIKNDILFVMELLKKLGLELCVVNYSRPDLPLKTLKVIVPGLCHFWPQLANERLYKVPVKLGWLTRPLQENEVNPQELYL